MKLILEKDVKNLGKAGDKVSVKSGYARNWLLPKKLAVTSDKNRLKEWKHKQHIIEVRKKKAGEERDKTLLKIKKTCLVFEKEARSGGQLFGSVSAAEISKELFEKQGLSVDKKDIVFFNPLKTVGTHQVKIVLDSKREADLSINIKKVSLQKEDEKREEKKQEEKDSESDKSPAQNKEESKK